MALHFVNPEIPFEQIVRYQHKNWSTVWIRCNGIAIWNEKGKPKRMLGVHSNLNVSSLRGINTSIANSQLKENDGFITKKTTFFGQLF